MYSVVDIWKCAAAGNMDSLLKMATDLSGCTLLLGDPILAICGHTCEIDTKGWNWERYIQEGYAPDFGKSVFFPKETRMVFSEDREGWLGRLPDSKRAHLLLDLHTPGGDCYHLVVSSENIEDLKSNLELFDTVSQALLVLLIRNEAEIGRSLTIERFLSRLLSGDLDEIELIESRAKLMHYPTEGYFSLLTIDIANFKPVKDSLSTITSYLEEMADSASVVYKHYLVILQYFPVEHMVANPELNNRIRKYLKKNNLTGVRSRCYFLLKDTRNYFLQTLQMKKLGHLIDHDCLIEYPDMVMYVVADSMPDYEKNLSSCHPFIRTLSELDKNSRSNYYIETLKTYIKCGQHAQKACQMLHIHRNTLDYRIKKIEELVPINWEDGDMLMQIYYSIHMMELIS